MIIILTSITILPIDIFKPDTINSSGKGKPGNKCRFCVNSLLKITGTRISILVAIHHLLKIDSNESKNRCQR